MTGDIVLITLNALWGIILIGIGIEMVNSPPDTQKKKIVYRILFVVFGFAVIITTVILAIRNNNETKEAAEVYSRQQSANQRQLSYMQQKLETVASFESAYISNARKQNAPTDLSVALEILKIAQSKKPPEKLASIPPAQLTPAPSVPPILQDTSTPATTSALKKLALQLAEEIDGWTGSNLANAPPDPESPKFSETRPEDIEAYRQRLNVEWRDRFSMAGTMMSQLKGLVNDNRTIHACYIQPNGIREFLNYRKLCAKFIKEDAEKLQ